MCVCPPKHPLSTIQNAELRTPGGIATNLRQHSTSISWVLLVLGKHHFFGGELFTDPQLPENAQDFLKGQFWKRSLQHEVEVSGTLLEVSETHLSGE